MPYFIETHDKPGHQSLRQRVRPAHLQYLETNKNKLLASGAKLDDVGEKATGGIYILDTDSRSDAEAFIAADRNEATLYLFIASKKGLTMNTPRYPYAVVPDEVAHKIHHLGGRALNLYRVLANAPAMLSAWVDFAYRIRLECKTLRALRELMILRTAQLSDSFYEWHQHRLMAAEAGVPERF